MVDVALDVFTPYYASRGCMTPDVDVSVTRVGIIGISLCSSVRISTQLNDDVRSGESGP